MGEEQSQPSVHSTASTGPDIAVDAVPEWFLAVSTRHSPLRETFLPLDKLLDDCCYLFFPFSG